MKHAKPLPDALTARYRTWRGDSYAAQKDKYAQLATHGQSPSTMVISCCDSRVQASSIFGSDIGEFFIHRNIANLVPPYQPSSDNHGTSAALEYAVLVLQVKWLIVLGHSQCGGVQGFLDIHYGKAPQLAGKTHFIGKWISLLQPAFARLQEKDNNPSNDALAPAALERAGVIMSLENLQTFPFIQDAVTAGRLQLCGLWHDIGTGTLHYYDAQKGQFAEV